MGKPFDNRGCFVSRQCPECYGTLQPEPDLLGGALTWRCDGLADPNDPNKELEPCTFTHKDGEPTK